MEKNERSVIYFMKERKLGTFQAIAIVVTVMISHIILNLPNHLIAETGSSTILNIIYIFAIFLVFLYIILKIFKLFPSSDIIDICEYAAGKTIKNVFAIIVCIYLLILSAFVVRILAESLALISFPNINLEIILLIFIAVSAILNLFGFKAISRITVFILPIVLASMIIIFISSMSEFVPERALPILGYGASETFITGLRKYICF